MKPTIHALHMRPTVDGVSVFGPVAQQLEQLRPSAREQILLLVVDARRARGDQRTVQFEL